MPCSPEEIQRLSQLIAEGKYGETKAVPFSLDTSEVGSAAEAVTKAKLGWLSPIRTMRAAFGDEMGVRAVDPVIQNDIKANNFTSRLYREYKEATAPLRRKFRGLSEEKDIEIANALEHIDRNGKFTGPEATFDPLVVDSAKKVRSIYNRLFTEFGIDDDLYRNGYRPMIKQRPSGIMYEPLDTPLENAFRSKITPEQVNFYHELERKGTLLDPDPTATAGFVAYVRGLANAKIRRPLIEQIEKDIVNPAFGVRYIRDSEGVARVMANDAVGHGLWKEMVHHVFGGPTPLDKTMTMTLKGMAKMFGKDTDTRALYKISHGLTSAFYAGALGSPLGGRPSSIIRQLFQLVPTYAELGAKHTMEGITRTMKPGGIQKLIDRDLISSPIEGLAETVGIARGAGRVISDVTENFLKVFSAVDQFTRAATAHGAESKFDEYLSKGILNKLPGKKEFKDELSVLVKRGQIDEARNRYMFETVANLQYVYGKANRPQAFRGAIGNLASTLMSYPMNSFEMARMFTKRAAGALPGGGGELNDAAPLARLILTSAALMYAGSEFLNADLRSAFLTGAVPHSLAFPKIGMDTFSAGASTAEWLTGNLFNVGESDFHKHQRQDGYTAFARDMRTFVPGGIFFFEDIPRAIDEGSLTRMLALTPKADVINAQAKARAQESKNANGLQLKGFGR